MTYDQHAASLIAAQSGDDRAFAELTGRYAVELHTHCYQMLGSVHDADEGLQDVWFRAWRGLGGFTGRGTVRGWLYRIATNVCLTMIEQRGRRVLPMDLSSAPVTETAWLEPYPDTVSLVLDNRSDPHERAERREHLTLAFVAALQHLPGNERAALLLREVVGYSAREVADLMDTSVAAVNSALQRARRMVGERIGGGGTASRPALEDKRVVQVVDAYVDAMERADLAALVGLLTDDVTWSMPPMGSWFRGKDAVADFLADGPMRHKWRHLVTVANGQPAVGCYLWSPEECCFLAQVLDVLTVDDGRITAVTSFVDGALMARFGLPTALNG
ncbi:MAG: sigma-70 family RNA polymerase sigma factor [Mycobacterium sp.]